MLLYTLAYFNVALEKDLSYTATRRGPKSTVRRIDLHDEFDKQLFAALGNVKFCKELYI